MTATHELVVPRSIPMTSSALAAEDTLREVGEATVGAARMSIVNALPYLMLRTKTPSASRVNSPACECVCGRRAINQPPGENAFTWA